MRTDEIGGSMNGNKQIWDCLLLLVRSLGRRLACLIVAHAIKLQKI